MALSGFVGRSRKAFFTSHQCRGRGAGCESSPFCGLGGKAGLMFQGRPATGDAGWRKLNIYFRQVTASGSLLPLHSLGHASGIATYPTMIYEKPESSVRCVDGAIGCGTNRRSEPWPIHGGESRRRKHGPQPAASSSIGLFEYSTHSSSFSPSLANARRPRSPRENHSSNAAFLLYGSHTLALGGAQPGGEWASRE